MPAYPSIAESVCLAIVETWTDELTGMGDYE